MTKISKALLVLGSVTILSGCGMKANFAKFKAAVGKLKAADVTKVVATVDKTKYEGTLQDTAGIKLWVANALTDEKAQEAVMIANFSMEAKDADSLIEEKPGEGESVTYFVNNLGIEHVNKDGDKTKIEWNGKGLVTSYVFDSKADDSKDYKVTFKYSK
jgi:hypothetical protein